MQRALLITLTLSLLALTPGLVPQAQADHGWRAGASFKIGGVYFDIGYFRNGRHHRHPTYFYRTKHDLHIPRAHYRGDCYRDGGHYYHQESCPLVRGYFDRYGVSLHSIFSRYAPDYDHRYGHRYGDRYDHRGYDSDRGHRSHKRYRGHGEYRRHGRYDRGPRGRHRGHHGHDHSRGYCPYRN